MDNVQPTTFASNDTVVNTSAPKPRGFAAMDRDKVRKIASAGGKAAHAAGTAHKFTKEEAKVAGSKGGKAPHIRRGRGPIAPPQAIGDAE